MSKGAKYFQIAKSCSNLMLFLSNDILDFAQLESKQLVLNMRDDVEVRTVVSECVGLLSLKAETKGIQLNQVVDINFPKFIKTDGNRLKQILINLISNSIKYTEVGVVELHALREFDKCIFEVRDTGVGIEPDKLDQLFTEFTKVQRYRNLNKDGVGLGLVISKNLTEALGGEIKV